MNDHLEDDLAAMLARRADTNRVAPDLDRVVAEAGIPSDLPTPGGDGGRGPYVLSLAAALVVVVGVGLFAIRSADRTTVPAGEPMGEPPVSTSAPAREPAVSTTHLSDTLTVKTSLPPSSDQPPLTPTHTFEEPTTTLGCDGPGPTNASCGPVDDSLVSTTLGCEGPGPTNTECGAGPEEESVPTTLGCDGPGPTNAACDSDPDTETTQPQPTTSLDPADCVQVTTVPGCESLLTTPSTPAPTVTTTTPGPVESVTISTTAPAD